MAILNELIIMPWVRMVSGCDEVAFASISSSLALHGYLNASNKLRGATSSSNGSSVVAPLSSTTSISSTSPFLKKSKLRFCYGCYDRYLTVMRISLESLMVLDSTTTFIATD